MIEMQQAGSAFETLRRALEEVMTIESITRDGTDTPLRARGELTLPADKAFDRLRPVYEQFGYTPRMYKDEGTVVIDALPGVFGQEDYGIPWGPILLFIVTLISVFFVGANMSDELPVPFLQALALQMGAAVEGVPDAQIPTTEQFNDALMMGVLYAGSLLGILGAHEMGHFLMARRHKVDTTPPFFIPLPINILGTLGAVIAMREPAPNRRIQFDIGVAGPIAGLIVTVPVLIIGLTLSEVRSRQEIIDELPTAQLDPAIIEQFGGYPVLQEGNSLAYIAAKLLVFGEILPSGDRDVWIHPMAFAGWAGLLVTALNLIPVGQLDGGHVIYGLFGKNAQRARTPVIIALLVMGVLGALQEGARSAVQAGVASGTLGNALTTISDLPLPGWTGWLLWAALLFFLARGHAPVLNEITELDTTRRSVGVAMIVVFVLIFTPRPLLITPIPVLVFATFTLAGKLYAGRYRQP